MDYLPYAFFEGKIVPFKEANVSIATNALQYGTAIFGGIRGYRSEDKKSVNMFRLEEHYGRFLNSLKILNQSIPYSKKELVDITIKLAQKNNISFDTYIRPFAYAKDLSLAPDLSASEFDFSLHMTPLQDLMSNSGLRVTISNWFRINDNMIPSRAKASGGYINSSLAKGEAHRLGFDDAILLSQDGHVAEGTGSNFFMVRHGNLITPPVYNDVLEGITRRTIVELAEDLGIKVVQRNIDRTETFIADEVFFTGTGYQVVWIKEVDGRLIGNGKMGPLSQKIQELFFNVVRGKEKEYSQWLTKI